MAKKKPEELEENPVVDDKPYDFISSGCALLDCCMGGGFPLGRVSNIVGDKSTNKTGLSIELMANFRKKYPKGFIWYQDAEAAFDVSYALKLGLPKDDRVFTTKFRSIEKTYDAMIEATKLLASEKVPGVYVVDSFDALLPDDVEGLNKGYDAGRRAGLLNSLVTSITPEVELTNLHLQIVSQIRENVGVMFGEKYRRGGGKGLDFWASQVIWLAKTKELQRTVKGIKRSYGIQVKAKVKKNKIGMPFRECEFPVIFNLGVDDTLANLEFLASIKNGLEALDIVKSDIDEIAYRVNKEKDIEMKTLIANHTKTIWEEIEKEFEPNWSKY